MANKKIFISHATADDELGLELEKLGLKVWLDSRDLRGGNKLAPEISRAIEEAQQVIVVLSPNTINSSWVPKEIKKALKVERKRQKKGYRVIPLLLPGIKPSALGTWFKKEPLSVPIESKPGGLSQSMPAIFAALGEKLPDDYQPAKEADQKAVEELLLKMSDPEIELVEGKWEVRATATLIYVPANPGARRVESRRFKFQAPFGIIEADDLRWYLERYYLWPIGLFRERAARVEQQLPKWGEALYQNTLGNQTAQEALNAWKNSTNGAERRFSVFIDSDLPEGTDQEKQINALKAATNLLTLPWELSHDGRSYLFQGKNAALVRRRMPNRYAQKPKITELPIRILLVSPRPEDKLAGYIDHRISAKPLVAAVESLGSLVELRILAPPTLPALRKALKEADENNNPFDVVHFDGHGVYDKKHGLGALCFEDPEDGHKLENRASQLINAEELAEVVRDYRVPLVFLEACQSAQTEEDPTASVAAKLLEEGVTSIVAMSHSVLVETARRFVKAFYQELASGARVGNAMLAGQQDLFENDYRIKIMGAGKLYLQDWFVPVLYQEKQDPQLFSRLPSEATKRLIEKQRRLSLGELPKEPPHSFVGRSRKLLMLERLLHDQPYAIISGQGGAGKTTIAVELAKWLLRTERYQKAAFISMENLADVRAAVDCLGRQLVGDNFSVAQQSQKEAFQQIERKLTDLPTLIILDNMESVLPSSDDSLAENSFFPIDELFDFCQNVLAADPKTRLIFTSREAFRPSFGKGAAEVHLAALSQQDAIDLVSQVLEQAGLSPNEDDSGESDQELIDLVEALHCHARALVLLAPDVHLMGVKRATERLHLLMAKLHKKYPDDRQKSLYASVELSLMRLPTEIRNLLPGLAVFHSGAHLFMLTQVLGVDKDTAGQLGGALISVGLAEEMGYGHLRLDPALSPYFLSNLADDEQAQFREKWAEGMKQLVDVLYQQSSRDAQISNQLTLLELPNLLALLKWIQDKEAPEQIVDIAGSIEQLLEFLGRPQALARVVRLREEAAQKLGEWSHAQFNAERLRIERLSASGDLQSAYQAAQTLLQRSLQAGEGAYTGADYDIAYIYWQFGCIMNRDGAAEAALQPLVESQRRFQKFADKGSRMAENMTSRTISGQAECLTYLGRLDEAAAAYEECIRRGEKLDDLRGVAVDKSQLGNVRIKQKRYDEALTIFTEIRKIFEALNEPASIATLWHQTGMVYKEMEQFDQAETAYRQSLAVSVQRKNRKGEAISLIELGNLYFAMGRLEEAVTFYRQAIDVNVELQDLVNEGRSRGNLADMLNQLHRYDEARSELHRAIECFKPYGHAAEPWKAWNILRRLEEATGNPQAAEAARQEAIGCYLAYRQAGGESQTGGYQLCALVAQAIAQGDSGEAEATLTQLADHPQVKCLVSKLEAILGGSRNGALADDPNLDYDDVVELRLLLSSVGS